MRLTLRLPVDLPEGSGRFLDGDELATLARTAEEAGFDAVGLTDHPFPPAWWLERGGHHTLEPVAALSFLAAATRSIRLHTNVLVLPYRNPFLVAKAVATLDHLSGGRVILGVAAGYLEDEARALGAEFADRNAALDHGIRALRAAWTTDPVTSPGDHLAVEGHVLAPRPVQRPHPRIWVGGNSRRAIRRAVELADGWMPFPVRGAARRATRTAEIRDLADLTARIAYARDHAEATGRSVPLDICFVPFEVADEETGPDDGATVQRAVPELAALGVTWLSVQIGGQSVAEYVDRTAAFGGAFTDRG